MLIKHADVRTIKGWHYKLCVYVYGLCWCVTGICTCIHCVCPHTTPFPYILPTPFIIHNNSNFHMSCLFLSNQSPHPADPFVKYLCTLTQQSVGVPFTKLPDQFSVIFTQYAGSLAIVKSWATYMLGHHKIFLESTCFH